MKEKNIFSLIILCILIFACQQRETEKIPKELLSKEKIKTVLVEKYIQEASYNIKRTNESAPTDSMEISLILLKKRIKTDDFEISMKYYAEHPRLLNEIYDEVINELSRRQAKARKKK